MRNRHETRGGMRWTKEVRQTNAPSFGRRSRVVLMPRRWHQVGDDVFASWPATVTNKPDHRGERGVSRKTIRAGNAGGAGEPVVTNSCAFVFRTRGGGCIRRPAFPAPSVLWRVTLLANLGRLASRDARACGCLKICICRRTNSGFHLSPCGRGKGRLRRPFLEGTPKQGFGYVASQMRSGRGVTGYRGT